MERYTKKQLEEMSDLQFAKCILQDRLNSLTNPYNPLFTKLRVTINKLDALDNRPQRKNWWNVTYSDQNGDKLPAMNIGNGELGRIRQMMDKGYSCGEICVDTAVQRKMESCWQFYKFVNSAIKKYINHNWGDTPDEDKVLNDLHPESAMSLYTYDEKTEIWVKTENGNIIVLFPSEC